MTIIKLKLNFIFKFKKTNFNDYKFDYIRTSKQLFSETTTKSKDNSNIQQSSKSNFKISKKSQITNNLNSIMSNYNNNFRIFSINNDKLIHNSKDINDFEILKTNIFQSDKNLCPLKPIYPYAYFNKPMIYFYSDFNNSLYRFQNYEFQNTLIYLSLFNLSLLYYSGVTLQLPYIFFGSLILFRSCSNIIYNLFVNDVEFISLLNEKEVIIKVNGNLELFKIKDLEFIKFMNLRKKCSKSNEKFNSIFLIFKSKYKLVRYRIMLTPYSKIEIKNDDKNEIKDKKKNISNSKIPFVFEQYNDSLNNQNECMVDLYLLLYLLRKDVGEFKY